MNYLLIPHPHLFYPVTWDWLTGECPSFVCILHMRRGADKSSLCNHCEKRWSQMSGIGEKCTNYEKLYMLLIASTAKQYADDITGWNVKYIYINCSLKQRAMRTKTMWASYCLYVFEFTCERGLLCATAALPLWCAPLLKPNEAASGRAHPLRSAGGSPWCSPTIDGMYWCGHTCGRGRGIRRKMRLWKNGSAFFMCNVHSTVKLEVRVLIQGQEWRGFFC